MSIAAPETGPVIALPGTGPVPSPAPIYVDGIPAQLATPPVSPASLANRGQRFWSSVPRPIDSDIQENLYVSLAQPQTINYLSFALAHFPQQFTVSWMDQSGNWQLVLWRNGTPLSIAVTGSIPLIVNNQAALAAGMNPYHYGAGHWEHFDEIITPVTTAQLRFSGVRAGAVALPDYAQPVDAAGHPSPYPLGIRDLDFGFRVLTREDVPYTPRSSSVTSERQPFASTADVHGSPMNVSLRENRASDLLAGTGTWRSAPQLRSDAIVNLYVDARAASGEPQVVDGFSLTPVTAGVRCNLYYAPDAPPPGASTEATDTPLVSPAIQAGGTQIPQTVSEGILFPDTSGWIQISGQASGITSGAPWWAAITIQPQFSSSSNSGYLLLDTGVFQLYFSAGSFYVQSAGGSQLASWTVPFSAGDELTFAVIYDGTTLHFWMSGRGMFSYALTESIQVPVISLGAVLSGTLPGGNFLLTAMAIGQQQLTMDADMPDPVLRQYASDPAAFVYSADGEGPADVVVRFSPEFILGPELVIPPPAGGTAGNSTSSINPWGFVGGATTAYESCTWIPVCRDFKLAQGLMEFDPVQASCFKFEFTSLAAEPYDFIDIVPVSVQSLPVNPTTAPLLLAKPKPTSLDSGLSVNKTLAPTVTYADIPAPQGPYRASTALPRQAVHGENAAVSDQLVTQGGSLYNFQHYKPATTVPLQPVAGIHVYGEGEYQAHSRVAYFVALSGIVMYRTSYQAQDDTEEYTELFYDETNYSLSTGGFPELSWNWSPGQLTTGSDFLSWTGVATATSAIFPSEHNVTGIQFATTQSDAIQLFPDPSFAQPGLPSWAPVGDVAELPIATGINSALGAMVECTRAPAVYSWQLLEDSFTSWAALESALPTWKSFKTVPVASTFGGMTCTELQSTTAAGRIYAAVRVFAPTALTEPLVLQILDGASGAVIAEAESDVLGGVVTEWYAGYTIGTADESQALDWAEVMAQYPTWAATEGQYWYQLDMVFYPLGQRVTAQLIQRGITEDTWYVDNLSMFEDAIVWSFSNDRGKSWYPAYDIRNNPSGVMLFGPPAQGTGNHLMWKLQGYRPGLAVTSLAIRPWYTVFPHGYPSRPAGIGHGPNISPLDHYPPIMQDPRWRTWDEPVPQSWYFAYQQLLLQGAVYTPVIPPPPAPLVPAAVLASPLAISAASQAPAAAAEPVIYDDVFVDIYTDTYGIPAAGDIYDDIYDDTYAASSLQVTGTLHSASAALSASATMTAVAKAVARTGPLAGADLGYVPGEGTAVSDFTALTGALGMRRVYMGNSIPASLASSVVAYDAGVRKVFLDFQPDATTTPEELGNFLADCAAGGLEAEISLWSNPETAFTSTADFFSICQQYVPVIQASGYSYIFVIGNTTAARAGLQTWWPGAYVNVNGLSVSFYAASAAPGDIFPTGMFNPDLAAAADWADASGLSLGLAEFGADWSKISVAQGSTFLDYVLSFFRDRVTAGKAVGDLVYSSVGSYTLTNAPASWVTLYSQIRAMLANGS